MHNIRDKLSVKNMSDLTIKAIKGFIILKILQKKKSKKYERYVDNLIRIYIRESLALSIIINCRIPTAIEFRSKLRFNQHDLIMTKEQSVLTKNNENICGRKSIATTFCFKL